MSPLLTLLLKALNGGVVVSAFSVFGEVAKPKRFAGLFAAAPSVALANLTVLVLTGGQGELATHAKGMFFGSIAFLGYALSCNALLRRFGALVGSIAAFATWVAFAAPLYWWVAR